jgi:hypothetical protein
MADGGWTQRQCNSPVARFLLAAAILSGVPADVAGADWTAIADTKLSYTTDAFQFSSARRIRFSEDPSLPTVVPVERPEDVIWEPSLELIRSFSSGHDRTDLSFKAHGYLYTDKPIFNHGEYRFQVRQTLGPDTTVLLRYRHIPNLFLGPNFEQRTGQRTIQEERVTTNGWRLEVDRRISDTLTASLAGRFGLRSYNEPFAERDTRFLSAGPGLSYRVTPWAKALLNYMYERGIADGAGDTRFNDDVSYRLHHVSTGTELSFQERWSLALTYTFQRKNFTSELAGDTHLGRQDNLHQGLMELGYHPRENLALTLSFQHTQRNSSNALRSFNDTIYSIGGEYRF